MDEPEQQRKARHRLAIIRHAEEVRGTWRSPAVTTGSVGLERRPCPRCRRARFTSSFDEAFKADGIQIIRTPIRGPRAHAFVGTVRRECLDRMLIFGRRHLEGVLAEYVAHYNGHRPHRALGQHAPLTGKTPPSARDPVPAQLQRSDVVFGLIHEYRVVA